MVITNMSQEDQDAFGRLEREARGLTSMLKYKVHPDKVLQMV